MADQDPSSRWRLALFGVPIRVHASWLVLAVLIAWSLAAGAFPGLYKGLGPSAYWAMAVLVVLGLAVSVVLHELAHSLVARLFGVPVDRITLFVFGGVAEARDEPRTPLAEMAVALAGPVCSLALSYNLAFAAEALSLANAAPLVTGPLRYLASLNLVLALFNLTPAFPMDGGRVLRALIWMTTKDRAAATRAASAIGQGLALLLMAGGLALVILGRPVAGVWWVMLGLFLRYAAKTAGLEAGTGAALASFTAREVMTAPLAPLTADLSLLAFMDQRLYAHPHGLHPVRSGERDVALVTLKAILEIPPQRWPQTSISDVATPLDAASTANAGEGADLLFARMRREGREHLAVVEAGRVIGLVTLSDLATLAPLSRRLDGAAAKTQPFEGAQLAALPGA